MSAELLAQTRGPRYNPGGGSSSGGSRSSSSSSSGGSRSSSSGSSYGGSRPSSSSSSSYGGSRPSSSSSSSSSSSGPRYNPSRGSSSSGSSSSSSSSTGPRYNPSRGSSSSSGSSSSGPRYNPNPGSNSGTVITNPGPRYNPTRYSPPRHQNAPGAVLVRRTVTHIPRTVIHNGPIRYTTPRDYHILVSRRYVYRRWIQEPVVFSYSNGYWDIGGYPYYVYRGYRYRYDPVDVCQYELVDGSDYSTVKTYTEACSVAYDKCAVERDTLNTTLGMERYFCAEAVDKDQEQTESEVYQASAVEMTEAKLAEIKSFLSYRDHKDLFKEGRDGIGKCAVVKNGGLFSGGNEFGCKFTVKVEGKAFPMVDESICSDSSAAEEIGCDVGNEKENAGCIMEKAIEAGYCL